jgi:hypothetical protein
MKWIFSPRRVKRYVLALSTTAKISPTRGEAVYADETIDRSPLLA